MILNKETSANSGFIWDGSVKLLWKLLITVYSGHKGILLIELYYWVCLLRVFRYGGHPMGSVPFSSWDLMPLTLSNTTQEAQTHNPDPDVTSSSSDVIVCGDVTAGGDVPPSAVNTTSSFSSPEISFTRHFQPGKH